MTIESLVPLAEALQCTPTQLLGLEPMTDCAILAQKLLQGYIKADKKTQGIVLQLLDLDADENEKPPR